MIKVLSVQFGFVDKSGRVWDALLLREIYNHPVISNTKRIWQYSPQGKS